MKQLLQYERKRFCSSLMPIVCLLIAIVNYLMYTSDNKNILTGDSVILMTGDIVSAIMPMIGIAVAFYTIQEFENGNIMELICSGYSRKKIFMKSCLSMFLMYMVPVLLALVGTVTLVSLTREGFDSGAGVFLVEYIIRATFVIIIYSGFYTAITGLCIVIFPYIPTVVIQYLIVEGGNLLLLVILQALSIPLDFVPGKNIGIVMFLTTSRLHAFMNLFGLLCVTFVFLFVAERIFNKAEIRN